MLKPSLLHIVLLLIAGLAGALGLHFINGWTWAAIICFAVAVSSIVIVGILVWFEQGYDPDKDWEEFDKQSK